MIILHTSHGPVSVKLDFENTPISAQNFLDYAKSGHYEGTLFHRVIDGFMVQGGGLLPGMKEKSGKTPIENEADKGGKNNRGTLAMARTMEPHSATAQFFVNVADNDFLNFKSKSPQGWGYCVFGEVVEGMDVVDKIKGVKTTSRGGHQDVPADDVLIEKVEIIED
jgi:peptidyl-prolyl cis-trans isomerase B (cyclophilin B)